MGLKRIGTILLAMMCFVAGALSVSAQESTPETPATIELGAVVFWCESDGCNNEPDGAMNIMEGAVVTSFMSDGTELDSCTTDGNGQCSILVPEAEDGTYSVAPGAGFETYMLKSASPESTGEGGDWRQWTFLPPADESDTAIMTVAACDDTECSSSSLMDGATVTAYAADGTTVDSCTIEIREGQADYIGCDLVLPGEGGTFDVTPGPGFEALQLVSPEPQIADAGERGIIYTWWFAPEISRNPEGYIANVVYCDDAECAEPMTMDGAVVESYVGDELLDSCTVSSDADDFDGCRIGIGANTISFEIIAPDGFEEYELVSTEPESYEVEREGVTEIAFVWTFVPTDDAPEPTATATATADDDDEDETVTALPSTGSGEATNTSLPLWFTAMAGATSLALAGYGLRNGRRREQ